MFVKCEKGGECIDDGCTEEVGSSCDCSCHHYHSVPQQADREEVPRKSKVGVAIDALENVEAMPRVHSSSDPRDVIDEMQRVARRALITLKTP